MSTWRAIERSAPGRLTPVATSSTSPGSIPARRIASAKTSPPSFGSVKSFRAPPNLPNGLRTALMTATSWLLIPISLTCSNHALGLQAGDVLSCVTQQLAEDFLGVLAEHRRRARERL